MKYSVTALFIFSALAIVGNVMADEEGGEQSNASLPGCPLTAEDHPIPDQLLARARDCILSEKLKNAISGADVNVPEEFRRATRLYCDELPVAATCVNATNKLAEICALDEFQPFIKIHGQFMLEMAQTVCRDEGVRLATVFENARSLKNASASENVYDPCYNNASTTSHNDGDASFFSLAQYTVVKRFKECLVGTESGDKFGVDIAISLLEDIKKNAPCIESVDANYVLCENLNTN